MTLRSLYYALCRRDGRFDLIQAGDGTVAVVTPTATFPTAGSVHRSLDPLDWIQAVILGWVACNSGCLFHGWESVGCSLAFWGFRWVYMCMWGSVGVGLCVCVGG